MFKTTIAGSLPKPDWLAETNKLWPQWRASGDTLLSYKSDATLLWIKEQEDAGLDIVGDGEQARQHFVHGFLEQVEGIDFENKVTMGIRNNRYDAQVPQVIGPLSLKGRVHKFEASLASFLERSRSGMLSRPSGSQIINKITAVPKMKRYQACANRSHSGRTTPTALPSTGPKK